MTYFFHDSCIHTGYDCMCLVLQTEGEVEKAVHSQEHSYWHRAPESGENQVSLHGPLAVLSFKLHKCWSVAAKGGGS